jgi:hypothetical protein
MFGHIGNIVPLQQDFTPIRPENAAIALKRVDFPAPLEPITVTKFTVGQGEADVVQRNMFIWRTL